MASEAPIVVWFRQDLRLSDNPALAWAAESGRPVVPLYILDETPGARSIGSASKWWLGRSLRALGADLATLGATLTLRRGPAGEVVPRFLTELGAHGVVWNRLYDKLSVDRDARLKSDLATAGFACRSFNASLLNEPWATATGSGAPFRIFTAYWRAARAATDPGAAAARPGALRTLGDHPRSDEISDWRTEPSRLGWSNGFAAWRPGEAGATEAVDRFLDGAADHYAEDRDRPDKTGTSRLSPHLHFGEIGPRQIWRAIVAAVERGQVREAAADSFLKELGWREFNHHLLFFAADPRNERQDRGFERFAWRKDENGFEAWARGLTGYPIVDAGMRELWATGWMHNRVRMIVASFLTKDLMIDWREGERWFWETLVDADMANNPGNWRWVAGSGVDAAPYFRIFNPALQGERFDPVGDYVRRWVPELGRLPAPAIHWPWAEQAESLTEAGVVLGDSYPVPIVEHAVARRRALAAYDRLKSQAPLGEGA